MTAERAACWMALLLLGCAAAPAARTADAPPEARSTDSNGLPRVSRYTDVAQLDWMLGSYVRLAERPELREEACLGYERTVFDLQGLRLYAPTPRRGGASDTLVRLEGELAGAMARHPIPAACVPPVAQESEVPQIGRIVEVAGLRIADPFRCDGYRCPGGDSAVDPPPAGLGAEGDAIQERWGLHELRVALGLPLTADAAIPTAADLPRLHYLATQGPLRPAIRLRASYHHLAQCLRVVERQERDPTAVGSCAGAREGETPPRTMARRRDELLSLWRSRQRQGEPLADRVAALVNATSPERSLRWGARRQAGGPADRSDRGDRIGAAAPAPRPAGATAPAPTPAATSMRGRDAAVGRLLFVVEDSFLITEEGLVIVPGLRAQADEHFRIGDALLLRRPDGTELRATLGGIGTPRRARPGVYPILLKGVTKEEAPIGTQVYVGPVQR